MNPFYFALNVAHVEGISVVFSLEELELLMTENSL